MRTKMSIKELETLLQEIKQIENRESYSDELIVEFPNYNHLNRKAWSHVKVTLLSEKLGVANKTFKIKNIDDYKHQLRDMKNGREFYDLTLNVNSDKLIREIKKELKSLHVDTTWVDIDGMTSYKDRKIVKQNIRLWFFANQFSENMKKQIMKLFKDKIKPFLLKKED